jgi:acetyl-CoA acetyltransferase
MDIAIVGVGHTPPARRSPKSIRHLAIEAIQLALDDAGLDAADIDGVITDGVIMPPSVPREFIAAQFGMTRSFDGGVSFGGAGVASAPELAKLAIGAGKARTVLFYFGVDWGSRASGPYGFHDMYPAKMAFEKPYGFNAQPSYFALWARRYMHEYGMTDADLAAVAISHRDTRAAQSRRAGAHAHDPRELSRRAHGCRAAARAGLLSHQRRRRRLHHDQPRARA